jgi:hypothetical protein
MALKRPVLLQNASGNPGGQPHGPTTGCLADGRGRTPEDRQIRLLISAVRHPITECASSSRCQISQDGGTDEREQSPPAGPSGPPDAKALVAPDETDCSHRKGPMPRRRASKKDTRSDLGPPSSEAGGARRDRTDDLVLAKHALSQLSYGPVRPQITEDRQQKQMAYAICRPSSVV